MPCVGVDHPLRHQTVDTGSACARTDYDAGIGRSRIADDIEVVIGAIPFRRQSFAAFTGERVGKIGECEQLASERHRGIDVDEIRIEIAMTKVGCDLHALGARFVRERRAISGKLRVQGQRGTFIAGGERIALDDRIGQHGDLVAGHVHGRQPVARDLV